MSSYEEEAFSRAKQMHAKTPYYNYEQSHKVENVDSKKPINKKPKPIPQPVEQNNGQKNLINMLFQNKEQSLILLLIVLLMEENTEPTLLLALMYILM